MGWLAGLTDGEGSFTVRIRKYKELPSAIHSLDIRPMIVWRLKTGDGRWVKRLTRILKSLGIAYHVQKYKNEYTQVTVSRKDSIEKLSEILYPLLSIKQEHAKLFMNLPRKRRVYGHGKHIYLYRSGIEEYLAFLEKLRQLNARPPHHVWTVEKIKKFYLSLGAPFWEDIVEEVKKLRSQGLSLRKIASKVGITKSSVNRILSSDEYVLVCKKPDFSKVGA